MNKNIIITLINKVREFIVNKKSSADMQVVPKSFAVSLKSVILKEWRWWLSGAILSFVLASVLISGWPSGLVPNVNYPITSINDNGFGVTQRLIEGWAFDNPRSGYPFGSNSFDYPSSDSGDYMVLKLIGSVVGTWYATFNLYILLGFAIVFFFSFCVLRSFGLAIPFAFTAAMIFNFLPFHFQRIPHLFYTWYFVVPIFWYVAFKIYSSRLLNTEIKVTPIKKVFYAVCCIALGSFGIYYAIFGLIMLSVAVVSAVIDKYNPNALKLFLFTSFFIIFGVLLNLFPTLIYWHTNGTNPEVANRGPADAEILGFKFVQLILPTIHHRNASLAKISEKYSSGTPLINENSMASLGFIGSIGLLLAFGLIFFNLSGRPRDNTLGVISLIVLVLFMFGTIGGFGSIFSSLITSSIRGWNRISIFIAFGSMLVFFLILQTELRKRLVGRRFVIFSSSILILLLLIGFYDQTAKVCKVCNQQTEKSFTMDMEFVHSIENSLPAGSAIYQVPYMPFPESSAPYRMKDYELSVGFLDSSLLRWSYMGMKGRTGDLFYRALAKETISKQIDVINKLGFAGIYVDKRGFEDNGIVIVNNLTKILGLPAITRADGEVVFFRIKQENSVNLEGLTDNQIMQKAGFFVNHLGARYIATFAQGIDFTRPDFPNFIKDIQGLSGPEPWGRWSDANLAPSVRIDLREPLPNKFNLVFKVEMFGPNIGKILQVRIGSQKYNFTLQSGLLNYNKLIDLGGEKVFSIEFVPPQPTSPKQLGLSDDTRVLGIGLVHLSFEN